MHLDGGGAVQGRRQRRPRRRRRRLDRGRRQRRHQGLRRPRRRRQGGPPGRVTARVRDGVVRPAAAGARAVAAQVVGRDGQDGPRAVARVLDGRDGHAVRPGTGGTDGPGPGHGRAHDVPERDGRLACRRRRRSSASGRPGVDRDKVSCCYCSAVLY